MNNVIWLAWEKHRRSEQLASFLGIKSFLFESCLTRLFRHPLFLLKTCVVIFIEHPRVLIVQNPSILLAFVVCLLKRYAFVNYYLIVDSHNGGIYPPSKLNPMFKWIYRFVQRIADTTIVTNIQLSEVVMMNGGEPFVLPDKIPDNIKANKISLPGVFKYIFICTFAEDEPIEEVLKAARTLDTGDRIYVTGNYKKAKQGLLDNLPESIVLTGFLEEEDYWGYLNTADCVIDLTLRDDCLVCGAYEATSVGKPLVLSDTKVLRKTFSKGAIYTKNNAECISVALREAKNQHKTLSKEIISFKEEFTHQWLNQGNSLKELINKYCKYREEP